MVTLSLASHRTAEMFLGMVLALVTLLATIASAVYIPPAGLVVGVVLGALLLTLAVAGTREESALAPSAHAFADRGLVVALLVAAAVFGASGAPGLGAFFLVVGVFEAALTFGTRYTAMDRERAFDEPLQRPH